LIGDAGTNRLQGDAGADRLYGRSEADAFVYGAYSDSTVAGGYDTIADFQSGSTRSTLGPSASRAADPDYGGRRLDSCLCASHDCAFNAATDLAISFIGANAIALADIQL